MSDSFRLRQLTKRAIRTWYWLWTRRLEVGAVDIARSDYKRTWQHLSERETDAVMYVASTTDRDELQRAATYTRALLERHVGLRQNDVVLEIGCGVGRVGAEIAPSVREWIGTDIAPNMLAHAARRLAHLGNVRFVELHDVGLSEIPDNSIDVVYCTVVFMHLYEWDRYKYVAEAFRVLKPGGRLYCDNIDIASSRGWTLFADAASYPPKERPCFLPMLSSADEFRTFATHAGFTDFDVTRFDDAWVALVGRKG
ncbi:MAG: class I SAM-dependent methyltransferase [Acidobacteria bacterium]|nr:class I SAM-dependent methyltransferase [Acidobacteriota bacterium]